MLKKQRRCNTWLCPAPVPLLLALAAVGNADAQSPPPVLFVPESEPPSEPEPAALVRLPEPALAEPVAGQLRPAEPAPRDRPPRIGIAARGLGSWTLNGSPYGQYGLGGALLFVASPRLITELHVQYHWTVATTPGPVGGAYFERNEIPVLLGFRLRLGTLGARLSPYLAIAVGVDYARSQTESSSTTAFYFASTYGAGAELRLGRHCGLTIDVRGNTLVRLDQPEPATPATATALSAPPTTLQGIQLAGGVEVYF